MKLPEGEDLNEWLAVNGVFFFFFRAIDMTLLTDDGYSGRFLQPD